MTEVKGQNFEFGSGNAEGGRTDSIADWGFWIAEGGKREVGKLIR